MLKEYWGNIPDTPEARDWVRNVMDKGLWTSKEVQELYGLSQSTLSRLYTKHNWQFAFKKGNQILFLAEYAKPWFDHYNAQQNVNLSAERVDPKTGKAKKVGRPKKVKGEYTYTLWGQEYTDSLPPKTVWNNWLGYIASQYPQFYRDGKFENVIGELIMQQPPELKSALAEVNKVFRKLTAGE